MKLLPRGQKEWNRDYRDAVKNGLSPAKARSYANSWLTNTDYFDRHRKNKWVTRPGTLPKAARKVANVFRKNKIKQARPLPSRMIKK